MKELVLKVKYAAMEYDKIIEQKVDEYLAVVNRNKLKSENVTSIDDIVGFTKTKDAKHHIY